MTAQSIFIVEDEIITAKSIAENIKILGYQVAGIATNSSKAIADILELQPDLILMDILLKKSELDGIKIAEKIQRKVNIPVVYITAHSDRETLARAKKTTPFGYILKPYTKKDLEIAIEMALYKHHQELELIEKEKLYSSILNATKDGVIATNEDSQVTYMNPAAQQFTGWNISEALAKKASEVLQIIDSRTNRSIPHPVDRVLEEGKVIYLDENTILIAKDGHQISIQDSISPIFNQQEKLAGVVLVFAPQKKITPILHEQINHEKAETKNSEIDKLSSDILELVIHELRTPLTIILSTSESLRLYRQRWTPEKQNHSFANIQRAVEQMTRLLDNVSLWEQADAHKLSFQPELIDVVAFCEELLLDPLLVDGEAHQLDFNYKVIERNVHLDPTLLRYALNNLLSNAIKYSPPGSTVYLTLNYQSNSLTFQVQDKGRGIPLEAQPYLFDSFYRAGNVENIPGTGMGLAIAKMCVELHQGEISFESKIGFGTTFTITLATS